MPKTVALGGDFRLAGLVNDVGATDGTEWALFPMQAQLSLRLSHASLSYVVSVALRGSARGAEDQPISSFFVSPEHYVYWRPKASGPYARLGRFALPYGLRLVDHTAYVRRWLGFGLFDEPYALAGGFVNESWELHAAAFVSDPLRGSVRREAGATATLEKHWETLAVGASTRAVFSDADTRISAGPYARWWLARGRLLWNAEVQTTRQLFHVDDAVDRWQIAAYAGPVWVPTRGVYAGAAYELFDQDLAVRDVERHAVSSWISYLPRAHFEIMLSERSQFIGQNQRAHAALLQLHYYP